MSLGDWALTDAKIGIDMGIVAGNSGREIEPQTRGWPMFMRNCIWVFSHRDQARKSARIWTGELALGLFLALLLAGCGGNSNPTGEQEHPPTGTYIDEPIVLETSHLIAPGTTGEETFVFDLSDEAQAMAWESACCFSGVSSSLQLCR